MPWPSPQDYREAIQNPQLCFDDPELRSGKPDEDMLGLPRPISGNFASVYRMQCGQRDLAVKCFFRDIPDQQQRYAQISQHLSHKRLPYTVDFDFLVKGIKVQGQWYPILKMGWISGDTLDIYVKRQLSDPSKLLELAKRWLVLVKSLKEAAIAHGDLQHGNVLVVNGDLKIIDYDGMYVPPLRGKQSHELGHPNYQHPQRTAFDFGPELDHFSAWAIYTCLVALGSDPGLWSTTSGAGDDCLLFHKEDFAAPQSSSTFSRLTAHPDPRVQALSSLFESMVYLSPQQVPSLDGNTPQVPTPSSSTTSSGPAWLNDYVPHSSTNTTPTVSEAKTKAGSDLSASGVSWVLDFIDPPQATTLRSFDSSFAIPRIIAIVAVLAIPGLFTVTLSIHITCVIALILLDQIVLLVCYNRTPVVIEKRSILTRRKKVLIELASIKGMMREKQKGRERLRSIESGKKAALLNQRSELQDGERREQDLIQSRLKSEIDAVNRRRQTIGQEEAAAFSRLQADIGNKIYSIDRQISTIDLAQQDELSGSLKTIQRHFLTNYLQRYQIQDAPIPGIGETLKHSLRLHGFVTAADVDQYSVQRVPGIGPAKAAEIEAWRRLRVSEAFSKMPANLPQQEFDRIISKYRQQRQLLLDQKQSEQAKLDTSIAAIRSQYASVRASLDAEQAVAQGKAKHDRKAIVDRHEQDQARLSQQMSLFAKEYADKYSKIDEDVVQVQKQLLQHNWELAKIQRELLPFANISFRQYLRVAYLVYRDGV